MTGNTLGSRKWQNLDEKTAERTMLFIGFICATSSGNALIASQLTAVTSWSRHGRQASSQVLLSASIDDLNRSVSTAPLTGRVAIHRLSLGSWYWSHHSMVKSPCGFCLPHSS